MLPALLKVHCPELERRTQRVTTVHAEPDARRGIGLRGGRSRVFRQAKRLRGLLPIAPPIRGGGAHHDGDATLVGRHAQRLERLATKVHTRRDGVNKHDPDPVRIQVVRPNR